MNIWKRNFLDIAKFKLLKYDNTMHGNIEKILRIDNNYIQNDNKELLENSMKQAIAQAFTVLAVIFLKLCTASCGNRNSSKKVGLGGEISISGGFPRCGTKKEVVFSNREYNLINSRIFRNSLVRAPMQGRKHRGWRHPTPSAERRQS